MYMKTRKIFSAFLNKVKGAMAGVGYFLVNKSTGKELINLEGIEGISVEQRIVLAGMLDIEAMFRAKKYDLLIRLGQLEEIVKRGHFKELIARYPKYDSELTQEMSGVVVSLITEEMLEQYITDESQREFGFFIIHPLGLRVLAKYEFSGYIAAHEQDFLAMCDILAHKEFPGITYNEYVTTLNKFLD